MAPEPNGQPESSEPRLKDGVSTGQDNTVRAKPFQVFNVRVPGLWDTKKEHLPVSFQINDPNRRIKAGRILYLVRRPKAQGGSNPAERYVAVHTAPLSGGEITHGPHQLAAGKRWDGKITEGLTDRERVTFDLCPIRVQVEVWNKSTAKPGNRPQPGSGKTDVANEYLSRAHAETALDVLIRAEWNRDFVIPYGDPEEPQYGTAKMEIELKNVAEGTPVRLLVTRINKIKDPGSDYTYSRTGLQPELQLGLEGAKVKGGKVVLADGSLPSVDFINYSEHWKYPGNNFYGFRLGFGEEGPWLLASERDYENQEKKCLHMRFTVFIQLGSPEKWRAQGGRKAFSAYKRSRYFRPYMLTRQAKSPMEFVKYLRHRYIVMFCGHGFSGCTHGDHPKDSKGKRLDQFHRGFPPDRNVCPDKLLPTVEALQQLADDMAHYKGPLGGCGHRSKVWHVLIVTGKEHMILGTHRKKALTDPDYMVAAFTSGPKANEVVTLKGEMVPRFYFHGGGCRTITTDNFGRYFTNSGTKYFHGWVYTVMGPQNIGLLSKLVQRWLGHKGKDEWNEARFVKTYQNLVKQRTYSIYEPRLRDRSRILPAGREAGQIAGQLR